MSIIRTMGLKKGAEMLGFKSTERLRQKLKKGEIPGCKPGREWVLIEEDIIQWMRDDYETYRKNTSIGNKICPSAKRKAALTIIRDSRSVVSECKNLRAQLREQKRKSTKKSDVEK